MASITREPIPLRDIGPESLSAVAFDEDHTIEDIVRYAVKCSGGSTAETRVICDWIDEEQD